ASCDAPAWLGSGSLAGYQCYDATYVQSITVAANSDVQGALLCRHKLRDSRNQTDFDDIAMILHNKKSGNTCWFQTENGETAAGPAPGVLGPIATKDGTAVPAPHKDTMGFWLKPSVTASMKCAMCHDNGPWMNSYWLYDQAPDFVDRPANKYVTPVYPIAAAA